MNRLEDLCGKLIDGIISREESEELGRLLANPILAEEFRGLLETESTLRHVWEADREAEIMARITEQLGGQIERGVLAGIRRQLNFPEETHRRRWRALLPMGAAASLALFLGVWWLWQRVGEDGMRAAVATVSGPVSGSSIHAPGENRVELKSGDPVKAGDRIVTEAEGNTKLAWISPHTVVELSDSSESRVLDSRSLFLESGRLTATVIRPSSGGTFMIETPHARAAAIGTAFSVEVKAELTTLSVQEGVVRLNQRPEDPNAAWEASPTVLVSAGGRARLGRNYQLMVTHQGAGPADSEVVYSDEFTGDRLDPFWVRAEPLAQVAVSPTGMVGKLVLTAAGREFSHRTGSNYTNRVEVVSVPISYRDGEILEITLEYGISQIDPACTGFFGKRPASGHVTGGVLDAAGNSLAGELLGKDDGIHVSQGSGGTPQFSSGSGQTRAVYYVYRSNRVLTLLNGKAFLGAPRPEIRGVRLFMRLEGVQSLAKENFPIERVAVRRIKTLPADIEARIAAILEASAKTPESKKP